MLVADRHWLIETFTAKPHAFSSLIGDSEASSQRMCMHATQAVLHGAYSRTAFYSELLLQL